MRTKKTLLYIVLAIMLVAVVATVVALNNNSQPSAAMASAVSSKLSDQPYFKQAYLIDPTNLSSDAKQALTGFSITSQTLPNGDTQIVLEAKKAGYQTQTYALKPGQHLYFVERTLLDDKNDQDNNYRDDFAVVVDANGYVAK